MLMSGVHSERSARIRRSRNILMMVILSLAIAAALQLRAQEPQPPQPAPQSPPAGAGAQGGGRGFGPRTAYPERPPADPAVIERGKALYGIHCGFCHGSDARGGDGGGPNLLRSDLVLKDEQGELIAPVVQNGRAGGMPAIHLTTGQIADIAAFIHGFKVGGYDVSRQPPPSILVGDPSNGEQVFKAKCSTCHSAGGDLKGFGARFGDPKQLQQTWLMPSSGGRAGGPAAANVPPTTVTVTLPGGPGGSGKSGGSGGPGRSGGPGGAGMTIDGRLVRIDDFTVTLIDADGVRRTFSRVGDVSNVEVHDPLQPHRDLLPSYSDKEIHDLTAYLVTLK
jgi:cytochrome c oxidase cbb3-type subunit III